MERPGRPQAESEPFYWSRQYVFVGATIPDTGAKGVASSIMERAPHAAWIEGQVGVTRELEIFEKFEAARRSDVR